MSNVKGLGNVLNNLRKEGKNIEDDVYKGINNALILGQRDAKMNAPVGTTGELREKIFVKVQKQKNKIQGYLYGTAEHHPYLEFGTGPTGRGTYPYSIKGYSLHYKANKWKVKIPFLANPSTGDLGIRYIAGQKAQPHMYPAFLLVERNLVKEIQKANRR